MSETPFTKRKTMKQIVDAMIPFMLMAMETDAHNGEPSPFDMEIPQREPEKLHEPTKPFHNPKKLSRKQRRKK